MYQEAARNGIAGSMLSSQTSCADILVWAKTYFTHPHFDRLVGMVSGQPDDNNPWVAMQSYWQNVMWLARQVRFPGKVLHERLTCESSGGRSYSAWYPYAVRFWHLALPVSLVYCYWALLFYWLAPTFSFPSFFALGKLLVWTWACPYWQLSLPRQESFGFCCGDLFAKDGTE